MSPVTTLTNDFGDDLIVGESISEKSFAFLSETFSQTTLRQKLIDPINGIILLMAPGRRHENTSRRLAQIIH